MWVFEEEVDGQKLTEIINTQHENVKYLPVRVATDPVPAPGPARPRAVGARRLRPCAAQGIKFTENVVADPDVGSACKDATLIIFVMPHQVTPPLLCCCCCRVAVVVAHPKLLLWRSSSGRRARASPASARAAARSR